MYLYIDTAAPNSVGDCITVRTCIIRDSTTMHVNILENLRFLLPIHAQYSSMLYKETKINPSKICVLVFYKNCATKRVATFV